ncbi:hypothetical protein [Hymenobacter sp. DG25B]|uniref:hypothetical protein n=1 Tax=Hymenobacter sp. DG25B TaxID=1385664 RepID=UPI001E452C98|nr:hypothetical protein [Hymenobacter sp. DG25B]
MIDGEIFEEVEFLGVTVDGVDAKSELFSSVSVAPLLIRISDFVALGAGAGPVPSYSEAALPYPMKSITLVSDLPEIEVIPFTRAILPSVALIPNAPVASGVGSAVPFAPPANCIR